MMNEGNKFIIKSKSGTFDEKKKDEINMVNVEAKIILTNGTFITLVSDTAKYNSLNSNTKFINNVKLRYLGHKLTQIILMLSLLKANLRHITI